MSYDYQDLWRLLLYYQIATTLLLKEVFKFKYLKFIQRKLICERLKQQRLIFVCLSQLSNATIP